MHLSLGEHQNFKFKQIDTPNHLNLNAIKLILQIVIHVIMILACQIININI